MTAVIWIAIGIVLGGLLLIAWLMDRSARRRGARTVASGDIWHEVREGHRDAEVAQSAGPLLPKDIGWTSWSKRNGR